MILYLWVYDYKHIKKTGFNLSSQFDFDFQVENENLKAKKISGKLTCKLKDSPKIFNESFVDLKAIIGENGSGKSTLIEILVGNFLTNSIENIDGFLVTDKYVFCSPNINLEDSLKELKSVTLHLVNKLTTNPKTKMFQTVDEKTGEGKYFNGQISSYLNHFSLVHYSPLLNTDRVLNIEGLAGSTKLWETDYWHYFDYTTENTIINDYHVFKIGESYSMSGESELLAHKSFESRRILNFLFSDIFSKMPFENRIKYVDFTLNDFYEIFWESIDSYLKTDDRIEGRIQEVINSIRNKDFKGNDKSKELESNLYVSFLYGALKYEYQHRKDFGAYGKSNALENTIDLFSKATKGKRIHKTTLHDFLKAANFCKGFATSLFKEIQRTVEFILTSESVKHIYGNGFKMLLSDSVSINNFLNMFWNGFSLKEENKEKTFFFGCLSMEFKGFSSGEKSLLSMFSRLQEAANYILELKNQTDVIFLLDEPEVTLHPQWQTQFIDIVNDTLPLLFNKKRLQLIITSHSPILLSDIPKSNVLFLEKDEDNEGRCKISNLKNLSNTFGANIHSLYADAFFLLEKGGAMGKFSKKIIKGVIDSINKEEVHQIPYNKEIINVVGEPLIKNQLTELFYSKFPEQKIEDIDARIEMLQNLLTQSKQIKERLNENN